jgi:hypothetical protein
LPPPAVPPPAAEEDDNDESEEESFSVSVLIGVSNVERIFLPP